MSVVVRERYRQDILSLAHESLFAGHLGRINVLRLIIPALVCFVILVSM